MIALAESNKPETVCKISTGAPSVSDLPNQFSEKTIKKFGDAVKILNIVVIFKS
jgi:hypothetical protein